MKPLDPLKEERILKAVITISGTHGLEGVNITTISKLARVSVGSIYTYFEKKEDIIQATYASVEGRFTDAMFEAFDLQVPVKHSLKRIFVNALKYRLLHPDETIFIDQYVQSRYVQHKLQQQLALYQQQHEPLYNLLIKGQQEGILANGDLFAMTNFFNGSVRSFANCILQKLLVNNAKNTDQFFTMVWKGMSL